MLFGDLVGFTTLSEARDPEEIRELLSRYFDEARTIVTRYGGTVEKFIGDAVMAVWGVPVAHEDDAERAVRAGLDLVAMVTALGEDVRMDGLALRVGVVTGEVAVTLGATGEGMVAGDAVNTAARVQTAAAPGTVWVDEATRMLTSAAVSYTDAGEHSLKGKAEPARLHQARAVVAAVRGAQRVDGLEAPFVGRDRDLRLVKELFHAAHEEGRPRLVTVAGVAGVGKSRLSWEFEKYVDALSVLARWHRGRCLSYGEGVAFWAFAEMIRSRLDLTEADDHEQAQHKITAGLERYVPDTEERAWIAPRLGVLLGHGEGSSFERADLFAAWTVFLERVGEGLPVVLLFEDLHHADSGLLDLIDHLLETARFPLFLLAFTRPELLERRPAIATGRRTTVLYLEPLGDKAMTALVDGLVDGLPESARAALVVRAEGVPLYAVETVRSLIDRDAVVPVEGRYVYVDRDGERVDLSTLAAPASLQTLIAARLDALTPAERRAVQDASVLGLAFSGDALRALSGDAIDVDGALEALQRKEIFTVQNDPRSSNRGSFRFLQGLVRQVAYDTLSRRDRKSRHLAAAAHLASSVEDAGDLAAVLAQHHLDALDASSGDDSDHQELAAKARALLVRAASRAEELGSPAQAWQHAETALGRGAEGHELHALQERAARTARKAGQGERAGELARAAREGYTQAGLEIDAVRALVIEAESLRVLGRLQQAVDLVTPVYDAMRDRPDAAPQVLSLSHVLSGAHAFLGNHDEGQTYALHALRLAESAGTASDIANSLYRLSLALLFKGSPTASRALLLESVRAARDAEYTETLMMALTNLASLTYPRDLAAAIPYAAEAMALSLQTGDRARTAVSMINVCVTRWLAGDWDVIDQLSADWTREDFVGSLYAGLHLIGATLSAARGEPVALPTGYSDALDDAYDRAAVLGVRALALASTGAAQEAATVAAQAVHEFVGSYGYEDDVVLFLSLAADLAVQAGDVEGLRSLVDLAAAAPQHARTPLLLAHQAMYAGLLSQVEGQSPEALLRDAVQRFAAYGAAYRLALAQLALGSWLQSEGRTDEATPLLDEAAVTFTRLGARPSLDELARVQQGIRV